MSPQCVGFHRCTGGRPRGWACAAATTPARPGGEASLTPPAGAARQARDLGQPLQRHRRAGRDLAHEDARGVHRAGESHAGGGAAEAQRLEEAGVAHEQHPGIARIGRGLAGALHEERAQPPCGAPRPPPRSARGTRPARSPPPAATPAPRQGGALHPTRTRRGRGAPWPPRAGARLSWRSGRGQRRGRSARPRPARPPGARTPGGSARARRPRARWVASSPVIPREAMRTSRRRFKARARAARLAICALPPPAGAAIDARTHAFQRQRRPRATFLLGVPPPRFPPADGLARQRHPGGAGGGGDHRLARLHGGARPAPVDQAGRLSGGAGGAGAVPAAVRPDAPRRPDGRSLRPQAHHPALPAGAGGVRCGAGGDRPAPRAPRSPRSSSWPPASGPRAPFCSRRRTRWPPCSCRAPSCPARSRGTAWASRAPRSSALGSEGACAPPRPPSRSARRRPSTPWRSCCSS